MTVFGIGTLEIILILLVMVLIFGPERITEMGHWLGSFYRRLTGVTAEVNEQVMQVRKTIQNPLSAAGLDGSIKEATAEITKAQQELRQEIKTTSSQVAESAATVQGTIQQVAAEATEAKAAIQKTVQQVVTEETEAEDAGVAVGEAEDEPAEEEHA